MNKTVNKSRSSRKLRNISIASAIVMCSTLSAGAHKVSASPFTRLLVRLERGLRGQFPPKPRFNPPQNLNPKNLKINQYRISKG